MCAVKPSGHVCRKTIPPCVPPRASPWRLGGVRWRELLASYGEVDAVDLLGAAAAMGGEILVGPERRAALRKARTGWSWWRPVMLRAEGYLMLPRAQARLLARKGGTAPLRQVGRAQSGVGYSLGAGL
jgi:hypothetical protein